MTARRSTATATVPLLLAALVAVLTAGPAHAHGAPVTPTSRAQACGAEGTEQDTAACRAALVESPQLTVQWDNVRLPDVGGRDREVVPDGELCSAGLAKFAGLDLPRDDWPATTLAAGADHTFTYRGTIPHEGTFRLYVTREGYVADQPLTWADLETTPFVSVEDPPLDDGSYTFDGTLPSGLTGRHLIYTIWENTSTPDTYYSCSDVVFEEAQAAAPPAVPDAAAPDAAAPAAAAQPVPAVADAVDLQAAARRSTSVAGPVAAATGVVVLAAAVVGAALLVRHRRRYR